MTMGNKQVRCYTRYFHNLGNSTAKVIGVISDEKHNLIYKFENEVHIEEISTRGLAVINMMLDYLKKLETEGVIEKNSNVIIYTGEKGNMYRINKKNCPQNTKIKLLDNIRFILQENKNWRVAWKRCIKKDICDVFNKQKRLEKQKLVSVKKMKKEKITLVQELIEDNNTQIVFFDVEMNCSDHKRNNEEWEIISLGAIRCNSSFKVMRNEVFYSFIKPKINTVLSDKCKTITEIVQEDIDEASDFNTVLYNFVNWVGDIDKTIFVSWGQEDIKAIIRDCKKNLVNIDICNRIKSKYLDYQNEFSRFMCSKDRISLINALGIYNLDFEGKQHNAADDALNLARIYEAYIRSIKIQTTDISEG